MQREFNATTATTIFTTKAAEAVTAFNNRIFDYPCMDLLAD